MAQNSHIYVFDKGTEDFSNTGLAGDLKPISAVFTEEKNGISEIEIRLTYDEYRRWKSASVGNYIVCSVPVRVPPVITNDEYANTVNVGR